MTEFNSGNRIRELRRRAMMSAKELGERIGTTESTISRIESGKQNLTQAWLMKIASALGVRVMDLIEEKPKERSEFEIVPVIGRVKTNDWLESVFYGDDKKYHIPIPIFDNTDSLKFAAFECDFPSRGWLIGYEWPKSLAKDHAEKEFIVCMSKGKLFELSLRKLEYDIYGAYLTTNEGMVSNRNVNIDDAEVRTLWRVIMKCTTCF